MEQKLLRSQIQTGQTWLSTRAGWSWLHVVFERLKTISLNINANNTNYRPAHALAA